jgi:serine phosphatase RsbU (regulator of sigma subunit)
MRAVPVPLARGAAACVRLAPGSVLALYTDGLVEQPDQDIDVGMSRLARTLTACPARSLDHLCDTVLADLGPYASDDIALLLARTIDATGHDTDPG